jgi:hypothetical protein
MEGIRNRKGRSVWQCARRPQLAMLGPVATCLGWLYRHTLGQSSIEEVRTPPHRHPCTDQASSAPSSTAATPAQTCQEPSAAEANRAIATRAPGCDDAVCHRSVAASAARWPTGSEAATRGVSPSQLFAQGTRRQAEARRHRCAGLCVPEKASPARADRTQRRTARPLLLPARPAERRGPLTEAELPWHLRANSIN